jgi:hypothetical protein
MLSEVQALCSPYSGGAEGGGPARMPTGLRRDRLALLLAVLGKHTGVKPHAVDVHVNVLGGACRGLGGRVGARAGRLRRSWESCRGLGSASARSRAAARAAWVGLCHGLHSAPPPRPPPQA